MVRGTTETSAEGFTFCPLFVMMSRGRPSRTPPAKLLRRW